MQTRRRMVLCGVLIVTAVATSHAKPAIDTRCIVASGGAAARCVRKYADAVTACRYTGDELCEAGLRAPGGKLDGFLAATEKPVRQGCSAEAADRLTSSMGLDDLVARTAQACRKWGDDFVDTAFTDDPKSLAPDARKCQRLVAAQLARVRDTVVQAHGRRCFVAEFAGKPCDRAARDRRVASVRARARLLIAHRCGPAFDTLGLVSSASGAMLDARVDVLTEIVATRSRHLAQRVYPPLSLGPTAFFGPHPVGVRTLELVDPSRPNPFGSGPRPLTTEVYYPSTPEAVAGVARDVLSLLGIPLFPSPSYRDVARAPRTFPLIVYSHGGGIIRFDSAIKMEHLASHGFVVVSAEHPGSDLLTPFDPNSFEDRPLDVRFLIDRFLGFNAETGHFLEGAIDPDRIGGAGWSFGGYAVTALATGPFFRGTFTDPRMKAIMPLDGAMGAQHWGADAPGIFGTITIPSLSLGGDILFSAPIAADHQAMFDALVPGPRIAALGVLRDAGHGTFPDVCEVSDEILELTSGGPVLDCGPVAIAWRYARHIINYLALNFFDGVLNGNAEALTRLDPAVLANIEDLQWQAK